MAHRLAPRAEADLDEIRLYVAKESTSIEVANRLIDTITDRFFTLAGFPYTGRSREDDFGPGVSKFCHAEQIEASRHLKDQANAVILRRPGSLG